MRVVGLAFIFSVSFLMILLQMARGPDTTVCVRAGSIYLGRSAVIIFRSGIFRAAVVPKFLSGKVLVSEPMWDFYYTEKAWWGLIIDKPGRGSGRGAVFWRADLGLVYQKDNPAVYKKLVAEAGSPNRGFPDAALGPEIVYNMLIKQGAETMPCKTRLLAW